MRTTPIALLARRHAPLWAALSPMPEAAQASAKAQAVLGVNHGPRWYGREGRLSDEEPSATPGWDAFVGLYRSDAPWVRAIRVFERRGRLFAAWALLLS